MAIDIFIASDPEQTRRGVRSAAITERVHREVWSDRTGHLLPPPRGATDIGYFPLLSRMADPYRDAKFAHQELPQLLLELRRVLTYEGLSRSAWLEIHAFTEVVQEAAAEAANVYAFGD